MDLPCTFTFYKEEVIKTINDNISISKNQVDLPCTASGIPQPTVHWIKQDDATEVRGSDDDDYDNDLDDMMMMMIMMMMKMIMLIC